MVVYNELYVVGPVDLDKIIYWAKAKARFNDELEKNLDVLGKQIDEHRYTLIILSMDGDDFIEESRHDVYNEKEITRY